MPFGKQLSSGTLTGRRYTSQQIMYSTYKTNATAVAEAIVHSAVLLMLTQLEKALHNSTKLGL